MMQEEIEALKKNLVLKCLENCNGEWFNLEVLDGNLIRVKMCQVNGEVRITTAAKIITVLTRYRPTVFELI